MAQAYNLSTWEAGAGASGIQSYPLQENSTSAWATGDPVSQIENKTIQHALHSGSG